MTQRTQFRWYNRNLPSLLAGAVFFLYAQAVVLFLGDRRVPGPVIGVAAVCFFAAAVGTANERRWAYSLGVASTALWLAVYLELLIRFSRLDATQLILGAGLLAMLLWGESREYQAAHFAP